MLESCFIDAVVCFSCILKITENASSCPLNHSGGVYIRLASKGQISWLLLLIHNFNPGTKMQCSASEMHAKEGTALGTM